MADSAVRERGCATPRARLRLLGQFALHLDGGQVTPAPAAQRLLAFLGIHDRPLARGRVADALWPGAPADRTSGRLRSTIHRVHALAPALIVTSAPSGLALPDHIDVDARRLSRWARQTLDGPRDGTPTLAPIAMAPLELLPGWTQDWVVVERERLRQMQTQALETVATRSTAAGDHAAAIEAGRVAVTVEPLRESAHRALIRAYMAAGRRDEGMRQYLSYRERLRVELGLPPSSLLQELAGSLFGPVTPE